MYIAIKNFKDGNSSDGWKYYKIGEDYSSEDQKRIKQFIHEGFIVDKASSLEAQAASLEVEAKKKQAEIENLKKRAAALKIAADGQKPKVVAPPAPPAEKKD